MDMESAIRQIEKVSGFDEPTSGVGEAWGYIKIYLSCFERLIQAIDTCNKEKDAYSKKIEDFWDEYLETNKRPITRL